MSESTLYPWEDSTDYPRRYDCAHCTADCFSEGADIDMAYECAGECGNRLCYECFVVQGRKVCESCEVDAHA